MKIEIITKAEVQKQLQRTRHHYPEAGHVMDTINTLTDDYFDELLRARCTGRELEDIFRGARRQCKFFPKLVDLLTLLSDLRQHRSTTVVRLSLPASPPTLEEVEKAKKGMAAIFAIMSGEITEEDGQKKMKELGLC